MIFFLVKFEEFEEFLLQVRHKFPKLFKFIIIYFLYEKHSIKRRLYFYFNNNNNNSYP